MTTAPPAIAAAEAMIAGVDVATITTTERTTTTATAPTITAATATSRVTITAGTAIEPGDDHGGDD